MFSETDSAGQLLDYNFDRTVQPDEVELEYPYCVSSDLTVWQFNGALHWLWKHAIPCMIGYPVVDYDGSTIMAWSNVKVWKNASNVVWQDRTFSLRFTNRDDALLFKLTV